MSVKTHDFGFLLAIIVAVAEMDGLADYIIRDFLQVVLKRPAEITEQRPEGSVDKFCIRNLCHYGLSMLSLASEGPNVVSLAEREE